MSNLSSLMIKAMLFFLGFISMSFQILYIREALAIFNGNELVIGFSLASWMMVTALGAYLSSLLFRNRATSINGIALVIFFLLLLPLGYFMPDTMAYMRSQVVPSGLEAGLGQVALVIVVAISPFCLFTGGLFTLLAGTLSEIRKASSIHTAYALDSAGSIFGGILLSIVIFSFPGSRFQVPGSRFQVPGSRFQVPDSKFQECISLSWARGPGKPGHSLWKADGDPDGRTI